MLYLLDANVLIDAARDYYPIARVPEFWEWLLAQAMLDRVAMPEETYEEASGSKDELGEWLRRSAVKSALVYPSDVAAEVVQRVVAEGYARDLTDVEIEKLGRDPFLIAHALSASPRACVVTTEASKPKQTRANRHVPDVCRQFQLESCNTFELVRRLDFSTGWRSRG
ncbi:DNA-binding protein [Gemmatimonadetes bacterium T265]|nr:DNA-binding protein [Gemmatimonadetes bacterium T265]